ncbi:MAG: hypothetical protein UR94_C0013G0005 [Parcubacteria group bacterium GW2011_GWA2_36_10]|nr:MAG: hypothetical protein UR94_C0013G0005 [Parcubacteria group bacterium GW2011_GWA2_36_10]
MRVKTERRWQRHLPGQTQKLVRNYYQQQSTNKTNRLKQIIFVIFLVLVLQSIFQIKLFRLTKIEINNNQEISADEVKNFVQSQLDRSRLIMFKNNNYFLVKISRLEKDLMTNFNLDGAEVTKSFPHTIKIKLQEKISQFIWQRDDTLYLVSAKGALNRQIEALDEKYLVLQDLRAQKPSNEQILNDNELNLINKIGDAWAANFSDNNKLTRIYLSDDLSQLNVQVKAGYVIKLDATKDINEQLNNLKKVLAENIITDPNSVEYIDLRFGDRIFFK